MIGSANQVMDLELKPFFIHTKMPRIRSAASLLREKHQATEGRRPAAAVGPDLARWRATRRRFGEIWRPTPAQWDPEVIFAPVVASGNRPLVYGVAAEDLSGNPSLSPLVEAP
jgi:hypothetical protein